MKSQDIAGQMYIVPGKNRIIGLVLVFAPFVVLVCTLAGYALLNFALRPTGDLANIIRIIVGFIGIVAVLGFFVCIPLGFIYMNKKVSIAGVVFDERSGKGAGSVIPPEIRGWNWGAAGLNWIWGVYHGVWLSLLSFIPYVGIIMIIVLGIKGNEWAWRARQWESVEQFQEAQRKWMPWGVVFLLLSAFGFVYGLTKR